VIIEKLKGIEKWKVLVCAPLLIGLARAIHFRYTGYFLPDEATYLVCVIQYFIDGRFLFYGPRQLFQFGILGLSIVLNLNTAEKLIPFFAISSSIFSSLTLFLSVKIVQKQIPEFKEEWFVPLLFLLSPAFCVVSGLILTEIFGIFFSVLTIYVFFHRKNIFHIFLLGLFGGLSYHLREPLFIISVYIILHFLYHKQLKNVLAFLSSFMLFFGGAIVRIFAKVFMKINLSVDLTRPILPRFILKMIGGDLGDIERLGGLGWDLTPAPLPMFIKTTFLDIGVMLLFSLGIFSALLIFYGLYKKKIHHITLFSFVLIAVSSMYLARYKVYTTLFFTKISTVIRYGAMGVFCIPLIPSLVSGWDRKKIKHYSLLAIVCMLLMALPFIVFVQSNLSDEHISRMDIFNYRAPWLILREIMETKNESDVLIVCEPMTRVRFYQQGNISFTQVADWNRWCIEWGIEQEMSKLSEEEIGKYEYKRFTHEKFIELFMNLTSQYQHVYLYQEKYSLYESVLESQVGWYWAFLENHTNHEVIYENAEMFLYEVIK